MIDVATEAGAQPSSSTKYPRLNPFAVLMAVMAALGIVYVI